MDWNNLTYKQWREQLKQLLLISDKALERAIIRIWERQTDQEKYSYVSVDTNGVGFSKFDAELLTGYAIKINNGYHLTNKEKAIARYKMPKYWRQLMCISKKKLGIA